MDKTAYGKGTFKTFGCEDDKGYLHKYSIAESIEDGTTLPLYYNLAPNEMLVPHEIMEKEFLALAEAEGIADIEELNKILERAVNLKNFLKGKERVKKVAQLRGRPLPRERRAARLQGVPRGRGPRSLRLLQGGARSDSCRRSIPRSSYTGNNNDPPHLKKWHLDPKREKQIRKSFTKLGEWPKILIVTEKLLTGFDAPILYAMYLDKPMRDHTLLQAIARVNRPYENEAQEMVKPHGFVLDFVGIFDKLEKALAFDSDEINAIVKDIGLLKQLFKAKMETKAPAYLALVDAQLRRQGRGQPDRALPRQGAAQGVLQGIQGDRDALRDHLAGCVPAAVHRRLRHAVGHLRGGAQRLRQAGVCGPGFQKKTNELVQKHIGASIAERPRRPTSTIDQSTIETIKQRRRARRQRSSTLSRHREGGGGEQRRSFPRGARRTGQSGAGEF